MSPPSKSPGQTGFHQRAKYHGISNVGDKKLVETQDVGLAGQLVRDFLQRILLAIK